MATEADVVLKLATVLESGQAAMQWYFWILVVFIIIAGLSLKNLISGYNNELGKLKAINRNFDTALNQLIITKKAEENIKSTYGMKDWTVKEIKTLKMKKLEELSAAAYLLASKVEDDTDIFEFLKNEDREAMSSRHALAQLQMIVGLYFPELSSQMSEITTRRTNILKWSSNYRLQITGVNLQQKNVKESWGDRANLEHSTRENLLSEYEKLSSSMMEIARMHVSEFPTQYRSFYEALALLIQEASTLMAEYLVPTVIED